MATAGVADLEAQTPPRNLVDLARRLRHVAALPQATPAAVDHPVGWSDTFNIADQINRRYFTFSATVRAKTAHAYFYVQDGQAYDGAALQQAAQTFESSIYPKDRAVFGDYRTPGPDGDTRIAIVNGAIAGVGGYFSASDEYPPSVIPYSNGRNAMYINTSAEAIGSAQYLSTIAHELQHMIHWSVRPHDDSWLNEGMSMLAQRLNGYAVGDVIPNFLSQPDVQLNGWAPDPLHAIPHYGAAYLFLEYFVEHFGGVGAIKELLASRSPDLQSFAGYLQRHAPNTTLDDVLASWFVANYLDDPTVDGGRFAYQDPTLHAALAAAPLATGATVQSDIQQYAARYTELRPVGDSATLRFHGGTTAQLLHQDLPAGAVEWWGNRSDTMDSTLTHPVDLRAIAHAQLDFSLWMDIEASYDYCYVEASRDGGKTWQTLPGTHSTTANPNGQNYGNGYTGVSAAAAGGAAQWLDEEVDLTPYAGEQILVRFEYVTDEAYNGPGVALRDVRIPAAGLDDAVQGHRGWSASGWLLVDNVVSERFVVRVILFGAHPRVLEVPLDATNSGSIRLTGFGSTVNRAVVVVGAMAPKTSEPGAYTLQLDP